MKDKFEAVFLLSGIEYTDVYAIKNEYECCYDKPWFLFKTEYGLIKIGWRKRVINIDWTDTKYSGLISSDNVTMGGNYIHAYGYHKAIEYLQELQNRIYIMRRDLKENLK